MSLIEQIDADIKLGTKNEIIARKFFLTHPTHALIDHTNKQYEILDSISTFFNIPLSTIQVAGSAKLGYSIHQKREFIPQKSDLDIAIIDTHLFTKYSESVFKKTNGLKNTTNFPRDIRTGVSLDTEYLRYLSLGVFRPDLMPVCDEKTKWLNFFHGLSAKHKDVFKTINACIYMSETFFTHKQTKAINLLITATVKPL